MYTYIYLNIYIYIYIHTNHSQHCDWRKTVKIQILETCKSCGCCRCTALQFDLAARRRAECHVTADGMAYNTQCHPRIARTGGEKS